MKRTTLAVVLIAIAIVAISYTRPSTTPIAKTHGQPCDEQQENTGCAPNLLCGQGRPENNFVWTCMTLSECMEKGNSANAVEGSKICFIGI